MIEIALLGLLGLNVFQTIYWSRQVQKLVDKVMSGSYAQYKSSETIGPAQVKAQHSDDTPEDLRILQDFRLL